MTSAHLHQLFLAASLNGLALQADPLAMEAAALSPEVEGWIREQTLLAARHARALRSLSRPDSNSATAFPEFIGLTANLLLVLELSDGSVESIRQQPLFTQVKEALDSARALCAGPPPDMVANGHPHPDTGSRDASLVQTSGNPETPTTL
jgi:hypothetical protein